MSLLENLPAVINTVSSVAAVLSNPSVSPPIINPDEQLLKPFVICHTRNISKDDLKLLAKYGEVDSYDHDILNNVDPSTLNFDYLCIDLREDTNRMYFQKFLMGNLNYHIILYKYSFESDMNISFEAEHSEFPTRQSSKLVYNQLLLTKPLSNPNACMSFLGVLGRCGKA